MSLPEETSKETASGFTRAAVRAWMLLHQDEHTERGEVNLTALAEGAAHAFEQGEQGGPLDDSDHWIWELAAEFGED